MSQKFSSRYLARGRLGRLFILILAVFHSDVRIRYPTESKTAEMPFVLPVLKTRERKCTICKCSPPRCAVCLPVGQQLYGPVLWNVKDYYLRTYALSGSIQTETTSFLAPTNRAVSNNGTARVVQLTSSTSKPRLSLSETSDREHCILDCGTAVSIRCQIRAILLQGGDHDESLVYVRKKSRTLSGSLCRFLFRG